MVKMLPLFLIFSSLALNAVNAQQPSVSSKILLNLPEGWEYSGKSDDPDVVLKIEKGNSWLTITRLNQDLGDFYLQAKLKDEIDTVRAKGLPLQGGTQRSLVHASAPFYHIAYRAAGKTQRVGFFTYKSESYAVSASGIGDDEFVGIVSTIRAPGENLPPRAGPKRTRAIKQETGNEPENKPETAAVDTATVAEIQAATVTLPPAPDETAAQIVATAPAEPVKPQIKLPPYIQRHPLPLYLWIIAGAAWLAGFFASRRSASTIENPRLAVPPKEIPADFFFPFTVQRHIFPKELHYSITSRQKQSLLARFDRTHETVIVASLYFIIIFHFLWSAAGATGMEQAVNDAMLSLPGGRALASFPEGIFLASFIIGLFAWARGKQQLILADSQGNAIFRMAQETGGVLIRDAGGKEIGKLKRRVPALLGRNWLLTDTDDQPVFEIKDEHPRLLPLRRLFGHAGGALQARYGIFVHERRAGIIMSDPSSPNRLQVHLEFSFSRIAHPALILACALYVESKDRDPFYPSPL